ncbi:MAG: hypothetical protein EXR75_05795 [Myxococcales bacterium]|nr:hypothetical protein [Myxococcales bacterium]
MMLPTRPLGLVAFALGARLAWQNIGMRRLILGLCLLGLALPGVAPIAQLFAAHSIDETVGVAFGVAMPLVAFAVVRAATGGERLDRALVAITRLGASRRLAAVGLIACAALCSFVVVAPPLTAALALAHRGGPDLASDALRSGLVLLLGSFAYSTLLVLGASAWKKGRAAWLVLLLDYLLGDGATAISAPFPRAHVTSLGGGDALMSLSQKGSSVALVLLTLVTLLWLFSRLPD